MILSTAYSNQMLLLHSYISLLSVCFYVLILLDPRYTCCPRSNHSSISHSTTHLTLSTGLRVWWLSWVVCWQLVLILLILMCSLGISSHLMTTIGLSTYPYYSYSLIFISLLGISATRQPSDPMHCILSNCYYTLISLA